MDGILEEPGERLLTDLLYSLPKEIFRFNRRVPERLALSFKEYLSNSTIAADRTLQPSITTISDREPLSRRCGQSYRGPLDNDNRLYLFL